MNRVRIYASAGSGMALATLAWFLSTTPGALSGVSSDMVSRSAGVALLGVALVSAGLIFRTAMHAEAKSTSAGTRSRASEYRGGFGGKAQRQPGVIVALRRAVAEQTRVARETGTTLPWAEIERLQDRLCNRTGQTVARNRDIAERRSMRGDRDQHDLAPR
jgi:hypothetical protein